MASSSLQPPIFPETLDKALVRPGRFDRHVTVMNPDIKGRQEILESHFKNVPRDSDVDLKVRAYVHCPLHQNSAALACRSGPDMQAAARSSDSMCAAVMQEEVTGASF